MASYVLRRLLLTLFVVWAALTFMFVLFLVMPGDPVSNNRERALTPQIEKLIRAQYGLDKPLYAQYGKYFGNLVRWDLGQSNSSSRDSVNKLLKDGIKTSGRLLFWGGFVQVFGSLIIGFFAAAKKNSIADRFTTVISVVLQAVPVFVSGLVALYLFGQIPFRYGWGWLNLNQPWPQKWYLGIIPNGGWKGVILPAIVVGVVEMAYLARLLRSSLLEVLRADYLRTAQAKGLSRSRVLIRHALRNALIPYVTALSLTLVTIFGIAVQTEAVFNLNGLGSRIGRAAINQDTPVVLGLSSVVILFAALVSLLVDVSYGFIDPRIRISERST